MRRARQCCHLGAWGLIFYNPEYKYTDLHSAKQVLERFYLFSSKENNGESDLLGKPIRHEYASNYVFSFSLTSTLPLEQSLLCNIRSIICTTNNKYDLIQIINIMI